MFSVFPGRAPIYHLPEMYLGDWGGRGTCALSSQVETLFITYLSDVYLGDWGGRGTCALSSQVETLFITYQRCI
jgi:hypothetical protein